MGHLFSYVLRFDDGFAPNPFGGRCSLANCKPVIRRCASVGDWVIGTASATHGASGMRLTYAMKVSEAMTFGEYARLWGHVKSPRPDDPEGRYGDAIYVSGEDGKLVQLANAFHGPAEKDHDLHPNRVLIGERFVYFGSKPLEMPERFRPLVKRNQGHLRNRDRELIDEFVAWLGSELLRLGLQWAELVCRPTRFVGVRRAASGALVRGAVSLR